MSKMASPLAEVDLFEYNYSYITRYLFYFIVLLVTLTWMVHRRHQMTRLYKYGNKIPGPPALPILGNALIAVGKKPNQVIKIGIELRAIYGNVARGWIGNKLFVFLADAQDVEVILNSHVHLKKASEYRLFEPWLGDGLLISYGEKWRSHRKIIASTFHINILKTFIDVFNKNSRQVVDKMRSEVGKTFDVHDYMSEVTVDILLETAMGINKTTHGQSGYDYAMAVMKMCDILHHRQFKAWLRPDFVFKLTSLSKFQKNCLSIIHGLTSKVIKIKKKTYLENKSKGIITSSTMEDLMRTTGVEHVTEVNPLSDGIFKGYKDDLDFNDENDVGQKKRLAFLDLMIESAQNGTNDITDHEIKEEVDTIMFEGHDTTAAGSSFVLCLLGVYQDVQQKVYEELHDIFGDSDRPVTFFDTLHMKYLERVILESLRLYPPVPLIARELTQDVRIVTNNYLLPKGATVVISPFGVHRNPKYYKEPDVFNPDNFLPENTQNRHYYSYIPFSAGPRSCVGRKYALLKLKVLLATILRNYKCVSDVPEEEFRLRADIILKRDDGFRMSLEPRK